MKHEKQSSQKGFSIRRLRRERVYRAYTTIQERPPTRFFETSSTLPLQLQIELIDEGKTLLETVAGAELNRELLEETQKQEAEIKKLQEEMEGDLDFN